MSNPAPGPHEGAQPNWAGAMRDLPVGLCLWDAAGRLRFVNDAYHAILRIEPGRLPIGAGFSATMRQLCEQGVFGPGEPASLAFTLCHDPSNPAYRRFRQPDCHAFEERRVPIPGGGWSSTLIDVTERVAAEEELSRTTRNMSAMLANIRHGIVLWDMDRRIVACNAVAETLLGALPGTLQAGVSLEALVLDADARGNLGVGPQREARLQTLVQQDRGVPQHDLRFTRSGRVLDVRSDPVPGGGFVTTYTDVTAAHSGGAELQAAKAAAEAASAAKSRFLATISHELRTPLNAVIGYSEALARLADSTTAMDPARVAEHAHAIQVAGRALLGTIDNVLDVARLDSGRFDLSSEHVSLPRMIDTCVRQTAAAAAAGEIAVIVDLPVAPPAITADERRLRQALLHVLTNALKFTEAPGIVRITVADDGETLRLEVSDSGIGIPPDDIERVSEPFTQADSGLARRYGGAGLGLYITRAIMTAHGGTLRVDSVPGMGTTASLIFPPERVLRSSLVKETT